ncbi:MAG TPA: hypothetical protein VK171_08500 [Fimbriimonas sp.]|nr:hypothetical protein [Fimbriimonas sp.]
MKRSEVILAALVFATCLIGGIYVMRMLYDFDDEVAKLRAPGATEALAVELLGEPEETLSVSEYRVLVNTTDWRGMYPAPTLPDMSSVLNVSVFNKMPSLIHVGFDDRKRVKFVYHGKT